MSARLLCRAEPSSLLVSVQSEHTLNDYLQRVSSEGLHTQHFVILIGSVEATHLFPLFGSSELESQKAGWKQFCLTSYYFPVLSRKLWTFSLNLHLLMTSYFVCVFVQVHVLIKYSPVKNESKWDNFKLKDNLFNCFLFWLCTKTVRDQWLILLI